MTSTLSFAQGYKKTMIMAATANPSGSLHAVALEKFKEIIEKESGGDIRVNLFLGGSMGSEQANVKQLRNGEIHAAVVADGNLTPLLRQLPWLFFRIFSQKLTMPTPCWVIKILSRNWVKAWLCRVRLVPLVGSSVVTGY